MSSVNLTPLFNEEAINALIEDYAQSFRLDVIAKEPPFPRELKNYQELLARLQAIEGSYQLPTIYQEKVLSPLLVHLKKMGEEEYNKIFNRDDRSEYALTVIYLIEALFQLDPHNPDIRSYQALQEINSDLGQLFFEKEREIGVHLPEKSGLPSLSRFGYWMGLPLPGDSHVYAHIPEVKASVVTLPPLLQKRGLITWSIVGHEGPGHHLATADIGFVDEIKVKVFQKIKEISNERLAEIWRTWTYEFICDMIAGLNLGPGSIGILGFLRGIRLGTNPYNPNEMVEPDRKTAAEQLNYMLVADNIHPPDVVRGYAIAVLMGMLEFSEAKSWETQLIAWNDKDVAQEIRTMRRPNPGETPDAFERYVIVDRIPKETILATTRAMVELVLTSPLKSLENRSLLDIQNWKEMDQKIAQLFKELILSDANQLPEMFRNSSYSAGYLVSGTIQAALQTPGLDPDKIAHMTKKMILLATQMHEYNSEWSGIKRSFTPVTIY